MITYPLHLVYKGITSFRNYLFDKGILDEYQPEIFSIGVGNLRVGGTGKTPMVNYLCNLLHDRKIGVISRGYGRKTTGFIPVTANSSAERVGDEPCMLAGNNPEVKFFVSEDRVKGYRMAQQLNPGINTYIFDDVFQHRYLHPHLRILLTEYGQPFYEDHVLPYGRLRETRSGAKRADCVVLTKCPDNLSRSEQEVLFHAISRYTRAGTPVFFAAYTPAPPVNSEGENLVRGSEVVLLSALANNEPFYRHQNQSFDVRTHFAFRDHYAVPPEKIREILSLGLPVITTGKDWVKIRTKISPAQYSRFYIPEIIVKIDNSFSNYIRTRMGFV